MPEISASHPADPRDVESIDAIIAAAYDVISGPAGQKRDWNRERSLFYPGARIMPTASVPGRNDVDLEPQMLDVESISRAPNRFFSKAFTKQKSRGAPNSLAESLTFGARTNRVTMQAMPRRSCAASTAFSFLMTASAGGSCPFTGSTRALSTRFRRNISSHNLRSCDVRP